MGRTLRHRKVIKLIFDKMKAKGVLTAIDAVKKVLPFVETTMTNSEIFDLSKEMLVKGMSTFEQERFPLDKYIEPTNRKNAMGQDCVGFDEEATKEGIQNYLLKDIKPQ